MNKKGQPDMYLYNHQWPTPGTVVSVPAYVLFRHKGIVSDRWYGGKPMVISNSARAGGVAEESWNAFTSGQIWTEEGHPGNLPSWEVLNRARSVGHTKYDVFQWNCESFVAYSHGLPPNSPQLARVALIAMVGIALVAARS
jgi:hypothetical protein